MTLKELTGYNAGIVVYTKGNLSIQCDWSKIKGLPYLKDDESGVKGDGSDIPAAKPLYVPNVSDLLLQCFEFDFTKDNRHLDVTGTMWALGDGVIVVVPYHEE